MIGSTVRVPIDADPEGSVLLVRIPAFSILLANGWVPTPLFTAAVETVRECDPAGAVQWVIEREEDVALERGNVLDRWLVACALQPRVLPYRPRVYGDELWVEEIPTAIKERVYRETYGALARAVRDRAQTYLEFVTSAALAVNLDALARRYGLRPSALAGVPDLLTAFDFDLAVAVRGGAHERASIDESHERVH